VILFFSKHKGSFMKKLSRKFMLATFLLVVGFCDLNSAEESNFCVVCGEECRPLRMVCSICKKKPADSTHNNFCGDCFHGQDKDQNGICPKGHLLVKSINVKGCGFCFCDICKKYFDPKELFWGCRTDGCNFDKCHDGEACAERASERDAGRAAVKMAMCLGTCGNKIPRDSFFQNRKGMCLPCFYESCKS
jgi:hypothetical protein